MQNNPSYGYGRANLLEAEAVGRKQTRDFLAILHGGNSTELSNALRGEVQKMFALKYFLDIIKNDPTEVLDICDQLIQLDLQVPRSSQDVYVMRLFVVSTYLNEKINEGGDMNPLTLKLANLFPEDVKQLKQLDPTNNQLETYQKFALAVRLAVSRSKGGLAVLVVDDQDEDEMGVMAAIQRDLHPQDSKPTVPVQASNFRYTPAVPEATTQQSKITNNPSAFQGGRNSQNTLLVKPKEKSSSCCGCM